MGKLAEPPYKIRYRKGDFELEVQGDKEFVSDKFQDLFKSETLPPEIDRGKRIEPEAFTLPASLPEFLKLKGNPTRHTDIAISCAYWLFKKEGMETFNINDIERCYSDARLTKPTNITDIMNANQRKGYLVPTDEKKDNLKAWKITPSGEEYVENLK